MDWFVPADRFFMIAVLALAVATLILANKVEDIKNKK